MDLKVYRISCADCDMKGKMRIAESTARGIAKKHGMETGHRTTVREVRTAAEAPTAGEDLPEGDDAPAAED